MAADWIKMRTDLYRDPKVILMADSLLSREGSLSRYVSQHNKCDMSVTRNVMRNAVVGSLVTVWGVLRHQGTREDSALRLAGCSESIIDDIAELPGFGLAMAEVGWAVKDKKGLLFPRFFEENNTDPKSDPKEKNAERQRRFRELKKLESNGNRNVTRNVTCSAKSNARDRDRDRDRVNDKSDVVISEKLNTEQAHSAAKNWFEYLLSKGCDDKVPVAGSPQEESFWQNAARQFGSSEAFCEAVTHTMANGWRTLTKPRESTRAAKSSKEWIEARKALKKHPDEWEKRLEMLGQEVFDALRATGTKVVATANSFELKSLQEEFESNLSDIRKRNSTNGKS